jgi:uncharacterized protein YkwD
MLAPAIDAGWRQHSYVQISGAGSASALQPELRQADLDVGRTNTFVLSADQLRLLEERASTTRKVSFRFEGPVAGLSNVFDWDAGFGGHPPVLSVVIGPARDVEPTAVPPPDPPEHAQLAEQLIAAINLERAAAGVAPLTVDARLTSAATAHNRDMAGGDFLSHTGSDGSTPAQRVARAGFNAAAVGEVLAGGGSGDPAAVVRAWLTQGQRDEVLSAGYTHIGAHYTRRTPSSFTHFWTVKMAKPAP